MKSFNKLFTVVLVLLVVLIAAANIILLSMENTPQGKPHRVEISRVAAQIRENGISGVDLSEMEYVTAVVAFDGDYESF